MFSILNTKLSYLILFKFHIKQISITIDYKDDMIYKSAVLVAAIVKNIKEFSNIVFKIT